MEENKYSVGRLIKSIRTSLGLSQNMVCEGLCAMSAFSRIEKGEIEPNPYLVALFFQRMGMAANKYGLVYTQKEYAELEARCEIVRCLKEKNREELQAQLLEYCKLTKPVEHRDQFVAYAELVGLSDPQDDRTSLIEKAMAAIRLTLQDFELEQVEIYRYSRIERALIVYVADKLYESGKKKQSVAILQKLLWNMERIVLDEEEMVRGYPAIACLLTKELWESERYEELSSCERAIELLYNCQELNGMLTLLKYRLTGWKNSSGKIKSDEEIAEWEKRIEALECLEREKQIVETFEDDIFSLLIEESVQGVPLEKLFKSMRQSAGITVAEVAERICEPESYSRIERGIVKPYMRNYQELMKRMGREGYRYYPNVVSEDYEAHLLYREVARDIGKFRYEEASEKLMQLVERIDIKELINRQSVQYKQAIVDMRLGRINAEQKMQRLWECLRLTIPENSDWTDYPLNYSEVAILNGIAIAEQEQGNVDEAINLLKRIKKVCESNPLFVLNDKKMYLLVLYNLVRFLGQQDKHAEAVALSLECAKSAGKMGMSYDFLSFSYFEIWNLEQIAEKRGERSEKIQSEYLERFRQIAYAAEMAGQSQVKNFIQNHCESYFGLSLNW